VRACLARALLMSAACLSCPVVAARVAAPHSCARVRGRTAGDV